MKRTSTRIVLSLSYHSDVHFSFVSLYFLLYFPLGLFSNCAGIEPCNGSIIVLFGRESMKYRWTKQVDSVHCCIVILHVSILSTRIIEIQYTTKVEWPYKLILDALQYFTRVNIKDSPFTVSELNFRTPPPPPTIICQLSLLGAER